MFYIQVTKDKNENLIIEMLPNFFDESLALTESEFFNELRALTISDTIYGILSDIEMQNLYAMARY